MILFGLLDNLVLYLDIAGYRSHLRYLAVSPQHSLAGARYTLLLVQLRCHPLFIPVSGVVIATSIFWSPFIAIGLLPLVVALVALNGFRPFLH